MVDRWVLDTENYEAGMRLQFDEQFVEWSQEVYVLAADYASLQSRHRALCEGVRAAVLDMRETVKARDAAGSSTDAFILERYAYELTALLAEHGDESNTAHTKAQETRDGK